MANRERRQSATAQRARFFVDRANAALGALCSAEGTSAGATGAEQYWADTVRSRSEEARLHVMEAKLDDAVRRVDGEFPAWTSVGPDDVTTVADGAIIELFWLLSSHPSGHIRQQTVQEMGRFSSDQILPHLANRAVDFVPAVRQAAAPQLIARLTAITDTRHGPGPQDVLPTAAHIAIGKLLAPRTARLSPELVEPCLTLAVTTPDERPLPRARSGPAHGDLNDLLLPYRQALGDATDPAHRATLELLMDYLTETADRLD